MRNIKFQKINHRGQGIIVGNQIKIQGSPDKAGYTVGQIKLVNGGRIRTLDIVYQAVNPPFRIGVFPLGNGIGFGNMLIDKITRVFQVLCQVMVYMLKTQVKLGMKLRIMNIDPERFSPF